MKRLAVLICFLAAGCGSGHGNPYLLPKAELHDRDLGGKVYTKMLDTLPADANDDADVLAKATDGQRLVWILRAVDDEIANGGYYQLFWNSTGDHAEEAVRDARRVGIASWADLLAAAIARTFPGGVPDREARIKKIGCPGYCENDPYTDLENRWHGLDSRKLDAWIRAHRRQFFAD
jgi:hypothetical protein